MKFRNQARLCLAIYDFEAYTILNVSRYWITSVGKILLRLSMNPLLVIFIDLYT